MLSFPIISRNDHLGADAEGASSSREAATDQWAFGQGAGEAGDFSERRTPNLLIS